MKTLILSITTLLVSAALMSQPTRVAIIDFENISGIAKYDGLGKAMSSMLISDIEANVSPKRLQLVERAQIQKVLKEQNFQASGSVDKTTAVKAGKILGVTYMLVGDVYILNDQLIINARLANTETGDIVFSKKQEGKTTGWLTLKTAIAKDIATSLSMPFTEPTIQDSELAIGTITTFGNAISASDQGNIDKAQSLADAVTEINPEFAYVEDLQKEIEKLKLQVAKNTEDIKKSQEDIQVLNKSGGLVIDASQYNELVNNLGSVLIDDTERLKIIKKIADKYPDEFNNEGNNLLGSFYKSGMIKNNTIEKLISILYSSSLPTIKNEFSYKLWALLLLNAKISFAGETDLVKMIAPIKQSIQKIDMAEKEKAVLIFLVSGSSFIVQDYEQETLTKDELEIWKIYREALDKLNYPYLEVLDRRYTKMNHKPDLMSLHFVIIHLIRNSIDKSEIKIPDFWTKKINISVNENDVAQACDKLNISKLGNGVNEINYGTVVRSISAKKTTKDELFKIIQYDSIHYRYRRIQKYYEKQAMQDLCYYTDNYTRLMEWSNAHAIRSNVDSTGTTTFCSYESPRELKAPHYVLTNLHNKGIVINMQTSSDFYCQTDLQGKDFTAVAIGPNTINDNDYVLLVNSDSLLLDLYGFVTERTQAEEKSEENNEVVGYDRFNSYMNSCNKKRNEIEQQRQAAKQAIEKKARQFFELNSKFGNSDNYNSGFQKFREHYFEICRDYGNNESEIDTLKFMYKIVNYANEVSSKGIQNVAIQILNSGYSELIEKKDPRVAALYTHFFRDVLIPNAELSEDNAQASAINLAHSLLLIHHKVSGDISMWNNAADTYKKVKSKYQFGEEFGKLKRDEMIAQDWNEFIKVGLITKEELLEFNSKFNVISISFD
jgi:TolB-like protein